MDPSDQPQQPQQPPQPQQPHHVLLAILLNVQLDQIPPDVLQHLAHPPPSPALPPSAPLPPSSPSSTHSDATDEWDFSETTLLESIPPEETKEEGPPAKRLKSSKDYFYFKLRSGLSFYFPPADGNDLLLPHKEESNPFIRKLVASVPVPLKERLLYLANFTPNQDMNQSDALNEIVDSCPPTSIPCLRTQFFTAYLKEIRLRAAFRKVLQRWRIHRMDKRYTPTADPITLEMPVKPVTVYDGINRAKYVFDAKSLSIYLDSKLMYSEGGFTSPIFPRNPWTNAAFSYGQLVSIFQQLQAHGELRVAFHTFRSFQFSEQRWQLYQGSTITMNAIRSSLTLLDSLDARDLLEDFLVAQMEELGYTVTDTMLSAYRIAMKHLPDHWYLQECKKIAMMHYEATHFRQSRARQIREACLRLFPRQLALFHDLVEKKLIYRLPILIPMTNTH